MTFADDAGEYSIFVKNQHGEASASASLLEEGTSFLLFLFRKAFFFLQNYLNLNASREALLDQYLTLFLRLFAEAYEAYMKQFDVTYKTEVTTTVIQEPSVVVSQYELEQRRVTTPMSFVSETVLSF